MCFSWYDDSVFRSSVPDTQPERVVGIERAIVLPSGPDDAREFVGQCHGGLVEAASIEDLDGTLAQGVEGLVLLALGHGGGEGAIRGHPEAPGRIRQDIGGEAPLLGKE